MAVKAKTKTSAAPPQSPRRVGTPAQRQAALEMAVRVSGVSYNYSSGASAAWPSIPPSAERRKSFEDTATILATAQQFLNFIAA